MFAIYTFLSTLFLANTLALNNQPSCLYQPNQTDFNPCIFNVLGGAQDQVAACSFFVNTPKYQLCLCTKSKAITECYDSYCPTDFSAPIFTQYFWNFCKGYSSNIPLTGVPTITGIPIAATFSPSPSPKANVTQPHSFFPSQGHSKDYGSGWIALMSSVIVAFLGLLAF